MSRATTTVRLPAETLRGLKARALKEGKSLNRLFLDMASRVLGERPREAVGIPPDDPLWEMGRNPGRSARRAGSLSIDDDLYGPVRIKPGT